MLWKEIHLFKRLSFLKFPRQQQVKMATHKTPLQILNEHIAKYRINTSIVVYDSFYVKDEYFKCIITEGNVFVASGEGRTKKVAMQRAAEKALEFYGIEAVFENQFVPDIEEGYIHPRPRSHNVTEYKAEEYRFPLKVEDKNIGVLPVIRTQRENGHHYSCACFDCTR
jgi:hypothetical protein